MQTIRYASEIVITRNWAKYFSLSKGALSDEIQCIGAQTMQGYIS